MKHHFLMQISVAVLLAAGLFTALPLSIVQAHSAAVPPPPTCDFDPLGEGLTITFFVNFPAPPHSVTFTIPEPSPDLAGEPPCSSNSAPAPNFTDGRCNQEPWQSFAVYSDGKGGYNFFAVYQGVGTFALHVSEQQLDDNPDTGVTHIIAQSQGIQLLRLAGGGLQAQRNGLNGKLYTFNIGTCGAAED